MLIDKKLLFEFGAIQKTYKQGDMIVEKGDNAKFYFQLSRGSVRRDNFNQEEIILETSLVNGQSLGESFLFSEDCYSIAIQAIEDCDVIRLEKINFFNLLEMHPYLYLILCKCMGEKLIYQFIMMQYFSINAVREEEIFEEV